MLRWPMCPFIIDNLIPTKIVHDNINNKLNNSNNISNEWDLQVYIAHCINNNETIFAYYY